MHDAEDVTDRIGEYGTEIGLGAAERAVDEPASDPVTPTHRAVAVRLAARLTAGQLPARERIAAVDDPQVTVEVYLLEEVDP